MKASTRLTAAASLAIVAIIASAAAARAEDPSIEAYGPEAWEAPLEEVAEEAPTPGVPTKVRGVKDFDSWYIGFHLQLGAAIPLGDDFFVGRAGREFRSAFTLHTGIDVDVGRYVQLGLRASALFSSQDPSAYAEGYELPSKIGESSSVGRYAVLQARAYPVSFGLFRPFVGVGAGYANAEVKATGRDMVCSGGSGGPLMGGGGGCAEVVAQLVDARYDGLATVFAAGLRIDVPLPGGSRRKKHPAGTLIPFYLEASYTKNFWGKASAAIASESADPDDEFGTIRYTFEASELKLDHIVITVGAGMMW